MKIQTMIWAGAALLLAGRAMAAQPDALRCSQTDILAMNQSSVALSLTLKVNGGAWAVPQTIATETTAEFKFLPAKATPWTVTGYVKTATGAILAASCTLQVPSVNGCVDPDKTAIQVFPNTTPGPSGDVPRCTIQAVPI
ncbi:MAG TPA: hypothetical protein VMU17_04470 [Elusimicrobiota bacterium]|nr:hypothetical protein [Elusimicrobiota bacterium]